MNYYNENDPNAVAWLRELIRQGHIAAGDVDDRSIDDVKPSDLNGYTQCHFFAGIGGWSLGLRLGGWSDDEPVWTGSCPCQPFSAAGLQMGNADSRHLFPAFRRLIARCRPPIVFGEQVASGLGREWLARVRLEMATLGYATRAADLCAASVGSPQIRQRLFWVAHTDGRESGDRGIQCGGRHRQFTQNESFGGLGHSDRTGSFSGRQAAAPNGHRSPAFTDGDARRLGDADDARSQGRGRSGGGSGELAPWPTGLGHWSAYELLPCTDGKSRRVEPGSFPLAHGVPNRVGLLRGYGNAIVPQVAAEFVKAFKDARDGRGVCIDFDFA